jgi:hypothetical protein
VPEGSGLLCTVALLSRAAVKWVHEGSVTVVDPSVIRNSRWGPEICVAR